ncbi:MAG TPA: argininosuccinate lyase [Armatimonadota bacterium]|nr:argininosuccinate lyase [Armatimonadota bacterium]
MPKLWQKDYEPDQLIERFNVGDDYLLDRELIEADCLGSIAHARMLARIGMLTDADADSLAAVLAEITELARAGKFEIKLEDEDVHTAVENFLTAKLGDLGKRIHTARSRNDQVIVDLRLYAKQRLLEVADAALAFAATLAEFAGRHQGVPMVGRTHTQRAMPSSVGLWAGCWLEAMLDDLEFLRAAYALNDQCPLGSAASYGVPLPIDRQFTSDLLGFARLQNNVLYANTSRGKIESILLSALAQFMLDLSRLAADVIWFSTPEFGYFELPAELADGSSIMPQKRNPGMMELTRARAATVIANLMRALETVRGLISGYNRDHQETKEPLLRSFPIVAGALAVCDRTFPKMTVVAERCVAAFSPEVFATDRALELVQEGLPFRDAYRRVAKELDQLADRDPREAIRARTHQGSTGNLGLDIARGRLDEHRAWAQSERAQAETAWGKLLAGK